MAAAGPLAIKVKLADLADNLRPDRLANAQSRGVDVSRLIERYIRARDRLVSRPVEAAPMVSGYLAEIPQEKKPIDDATLWGGSDDKTH